MIEGIKIGDITSPKDNPDADIIIGMNIALHDVRGIGRDAIKNITHAFDLDLGSVITFPFDENRNLHMIICHQLGMGGWDDADQYVRFGMDFLWQQRPHKRAQYSIVQIGTGRVGERYGADVPSIITAMATSHLPVTLFVPPKPVVANDALSRMMQPPSRVWHTARGELSLVA